MIMAQQPIKQAGFKKQFSPINHLHTINQILEKSSQYQNGIHIALIHYKKAFNTVDHKYMFKTLENQGIPDGYIKIHKKYIKI